MLNVQVLGQVVCWQVKNVDCALDGVLSMRPQMMQTNVLVLRTTGCCVISLAAC